MIGDRVLRRMAALAGSVLPVYPHACGTMGLYKGVRVGMELLHPCLPSVKMEYCCVGAAGAMGRSSGAGCCDGGLLVGSSAAGGNVTGACVTMMMMPVHVSSHTL